MTEQSTIRPAGQGYIGVDADELASAIHALRYHGGKTLTFGQSNVLLWAADAYLQIVGAENPQRSAEMPAEIWVGRTIGGGVSANINRQPGDRRYVPGPAAVDDPALVTSGIAVLRIHSGQLPPITGDYLKTVCDMAEDYLRLMPLPEPPFCAHCGGTCECEADDDL